MKKFFPNDELKIFLENLSEYNQLFGYHALCMFSNEECSVFNFDTQSNTIIADSFMELCTKLNTCVQEKVKYYPADKEWMTFTID